MLATPEIIETKAEPAAVIRVTIARNEMAKVFGPTAGELMTELASQGVKPVGAVFAHHLMMSPGIFDFELGVKVSAPVQVSGRVKPGELPAAKVARTVYTGPYEGLPSAWGEFDTWMEANGLKQGDDLWELYSVGPDATPDPSKWTTELYRPLKP